MATHLQEPETLIDDLVAVLKENDLSGLREVLQEIKEQARIRMADRA